MFCKNSIQIPGCTGSARFRCPRPARPARGAAPVTWSHPGASFQGACALESPLLSSRAAERQAPARGLQFPRGRLGSEAGPAPQKAFPGEPCVSCLCFPRRRRV